MSAEQATATERTILQWLIGQGKADDVSKEDVFEYYERRGGVSRGMHRVSRRGAAGRLYWRLVDKGYILLEHGSNGGRVSRAGRQAAQ